MAVYISIDAGGSKTNALLFDDGLTVLGHGLAGGVNLTQTSFADATANIIDCIEQMFTTYHPKRIDGLFLSFGGPLDVLLDELKKRTQLGDIIELGEPLAGLLASGVRNNGMLAIAGTGSDVFYIKRDAPFSRERTVGAYGPIIGDQGSGTSIGLHAVRAVAKAYDGWGPKTMIQDLIFEKWEIKDIWGMVEKIHGSVAPFRTVASVTPLVAKAAYMGDEVALDILRTAGEDMAAQGNCLMERCNILPEHRTFVVCGGAWKAHPIMFETFKKRINESHPDVQVEKPVFEHVMCGPVKILMDTGMERQDIIDVLKKHFGDYIIRW